MKSSAKILATLATSFILFGFEGGCGEPPEEPCPQALCLLACPFGNVVNADGCDTCECLPPPNNSCDTLGESACHARSDCEPLYEDQSCVCPACAPGGLCPPCECDAFIPQFAGCRDRDPCKNLDENACIANPDCQPRYSEVYCAHGNDALAFPCEQGLLYDGCEVHECDLPPPEPRCAEVLCALACDDGFARDPQGCEICDCL